MELVRPSALDSSGYDSCASSGPAKPRRGVVSSLLDLDLCQDFQSHVSVSIDACRLSFQPKHGGVEQKKLTKSFLKSLASIRSMKLVEHLRSPFLLPVLKIVECPLSYEYEIPVIRSQTLRLDTFLGRPVNDVTWRQLLVIAYQVSEGIDCLHRAKIIHGDIDPQNIWLDEHLNARLGNFHAATAADYRGNRATKSLPDDIYSFGLVLLQMLGVTLNLESEHHKEFVNGSASENYLSTGISQYCEKHEKCIDINVWSEISVTKDVVQTTVQCFISEISRRTTAVNLVSSFRKTIDHVSDGPHLVYWPKENQEKCVYCFVGQPRSYMQTMCTECPRDCEFLAMCPLCMPSAGFTHVKCPLHGCQIHPTIGGQSAYAVIIEGSDSDDPSLERCFKQDCTQVRLLAMHPRVMGIPSENVHYITLRRSDMVKTLKEAISKISDKGPDFFFLYYSGHQLVNVASNDSDFLRVDDLKTAVSSLEECPRIMIILDCCEAASSTLVPLYANNDDKHIQYHVQWSSCGRLEETNYQSASRHSQFATYLLAGLSGARKCHAADNPDSDCRICKEFRANCEVRQCITLSDLRIFVDRHMSETAEAEGKDDQQNSIIQMTCRNEPLIAYFTEKSLYTFTYIPPAGKKSKVCLERMGNCNNVLKDLWSKLRRQLPPKVHEDALMIYVQRGEHRQSLDKTEDIVKYDLDDESLKVTIRTEAAELDIGRQLVWQGDESEAKRVVFKYLPDFKSMNINKQQQQWIIRLDQIIIENCSATNPDLDFEGVFCRSWRKFNGLNGNKDRILMVNVYAKTTLIGIYKPSLTLTYVPPDTIGRINVCAKLQPQPDEPFETILCATLNKLKQCLPRNISKEKWVINTEPEGYSSWENIEALKKIQCSGYHICVSIPTEDSFNKNSQIAWMGNRKAANEVMQRCSPVTVKPSKTSDGRGTQWVLEPEQQIRDVPDNICQFQAVFSRSWQTFKEISNISNHLRLVIMIYTDITLIRINEVN